MQSWRDVEDAEPRDAGDGWGWSWGDTCLWIMTGLIALLCGSGLIQFLIAILEGVSRTAWEWLLAFVAIGLACAVTGWAVIAGAMQGARDAVDDETSGAAENGKTGGRENGTREG